MTYNAASRLDVRKAEKAAKLAESNRRTVLVTLADSAIGREWLWAQLAAAHIFETTFTPDPRHSAFLEGERNAGLRLLGEMMQHCPEQFIQAMREANERRSRSEQPRSPNGDGRDQGSDVAGGDGDEDRDADYVG